MAKRAASTAWTTNVCRRVMAALALAVPCAAVVSAQIIEEVIVTVNGDVVTRRELEQRQAAIVGQQLGRTISREDLRTDASLRRAADELRPQILSDAIDELLMIQRAEELGLTATDQDVDGVLATIKSQHNLSTDEQLHALLREEGIAPASMRESIRRRILIEQMRQRVFRRVRLTDEEARAFFAAHREEFARPATATFRQILVLVPPEDPRRREAAHERDRAIMRFVAARDRVVLNGEDFAEVAARYSDASTAAGIIGPVPVSELPSVIISALRRLAPGAVSAPVRTEEGYRLLKLESLAPGTSATFEAARLLAFQRATDEARVSELRRYLARLRSLSIIRWRDRS